MAVHLVVFQGVRQVVNLTDERLHILQYLLSSDNSEAIDNSPAIIN
jgi:hypothetical protein